MLSALYALFNIRRTQRCGHCYPQSADETTEAQRSEETCPGTSSVLLGAGTPCCVSATPKPHCVILCALCLCVERWFLSFKPFPKSVPEPGYGNQG